MSRELKVKVLRTVSTIIGLINVVLLFHTAVVCNYSMEYGFWGWIIHPDSTKILMYVIVVLEALICAAVNIEKKPIYHIVVFIILLILKHYWLNYEAFPEFVFLFWKGKHFLKWAFIMYGGIVLLGLLGMLFPPITSMQEDKLMILNDFIKANPIPYKAEELRTTRVLDSHFIFEKSVKKSEIVSTNSETLKKSQLAIGRFNELLKNNGITIEQEGDNYSISCKGFKENTRVRKLFKDADKILGDHIGALQSILIPYEGLCQAMVSLEKELENTLKGEGGEAYTRQVLFPLEKKYTFLYNMVLDYDKENVKSSEADIYILTHKGIICCEVKNRGDSRHLFHISRDGQWSKCYANGKFIDTMDSPSAQNEMHKRATEEFLRKHGISDITMIPIVILANSPDEQVRLINESNEIVLRPEEVEHFIETLNNEEKYDDNYIEQVKKIFEMYQKQEENLHPVKCFDERTFEQCFRNIEALIGKVLIAQSYENRIIEYLKGRDDDNAKIALRMVRTLGLIVLALTCAMGYGSFTGFFATSFTPIAIAITVIMGIASFFLLGTSSKR